MMPRIYPLECQFTDQQGDKNLHKFFSEACIFYQLFLSAFYYKSTTVNQEKFFVKNVLLLAVLMKIKATNLF